MKRDELIFTEPSAIERQSFAIIETELKENYGITLDEKIATIVKRVIHTTADFRYAETLYFSEEKDGVKDAVTALCDAIKSGATIVTDTQMALAGINKKKLALYGGNAVCYMSDGDVADEAKKRGVTRATVSMERAADEHPDAVFVIGNAPTALVSLYDLYQENRVRPRAIVAAPVGFVNVIEAKELIEELPVPMIVSRGRAGGSNVAAAIVNAIMTMETAV